MAYLSEKKEQLRKALVSWEKALDEPFTDMNRDASIQRFEYSFELFWKSVKVYLSEIERIECNSPNNCFRELRSVIACTDSDIEECLRMLGDRNFSVHTYSEEMANGLYEKLKGYLNVCKKIATEL